MAKLLFYLSVVLIHICGFTTIVTWIIKFKKKKIIFPLVNVSLACLFTSGIILTIITIISLFGNINVQ